MLAPVVRGKKGTHSKLISGLAAEGFARVRINGEVRELADSIELDKNQTHNIEVVVDRLIAREEIQERLNDSLQTCLKRMVYNSRSCSKGENYLLTWSEKNFTQKIMSCTWIYC